MRPSWLNVPLSKQPPWLRPPQTQWRRLSAYRKQKMKQNENTKVGSLLLAAILLVLVALLTGCGATSKPPVSPCPTLPAVPSVSTPAPSIPYSDTVQSNLNEWQKLLQATTLTP
mgnify:FL=1